MNENPAKTPAILAIEKLLEGFKEIQQKRDEIESKKSPEQKALEARQLAIQREKDQIDQLNKQHTKFDNLFNSWLKRDTWLIYDEAIPLTKGEVPEYETMFNPRDTNLWSLVQSCANQSLKIINPDAKSKLWKVKPFEWVRWLKEKEQTVHPQLQELVLPKAPISLVSKTVAAIKTREKIKAERIGAIKAFSLKAGEMARKQNIEWNDQEIPVTKADFLEVFTKLNTAFKKISITSFDRDIAEIGIKFKRGTKSNKNNVLKRFFSIK
ncbi:MAG: hypothetical protein B7Y16_06275 [Methylotenera sp. 24-45-7]|nr:MAG: hypothetical protein B7Y16_06275 [Methylotenera sp. 24-45-7]HQS44211.1 hypothetical protein [Methylotenera sp.]